MLIKETDAYAEIFITDSIELVVLCSSLGTDDA